MNLNRHLLLLLFFCFTTSNLLAQQKLNDCVGAITLCGDGNIETKIEGPGEKNEIIDVCEGFEHHSLWIRVDIQQDGELGFDLIPNDPDILVDYDFWVFGPNKACDDLGSPIRCCTVNPSQAQNPTNHTGINGSTTSNQSIAGLTTNPYVYWLQVKKGEFYYIAIDRPYGDGEGEGGFKINWTGTAIQGTGAFPPLPEANEIEDVKTCNYDGSGVGIFGLDELKTKITDDLTNNDVTFYPTLADATDETHALPNLYANVTSPYRQKIYAKVTSKKTNCYDLTEFDLIVTDIPEIGALSVSDTSICTSESVTFTIEGTPNATVFYEINGSGKPYETIDIDDTGKAELTLTPTENLTFKLIEIAVMSNGEPACSEDLSDRASITVTVSPATTPTFDPVASICEGETLADLPTTSTNGIKGTWSPALDNTQTTTYTFTPNPGQCAESFDMEIVVNPTPVSDFTELVVCTNTSGGINNFDLKAAIPEILGTSQPETEFAVTFYSDATATHAIATPEAYTNTTAFSQTIYFSIENTSSGCTFIFPLTLLVQSAEATSPDSLEVCDTDGTNDGYFEMDLTALNSQILNGQSPISYTVSYYLTEMDAETGTNAIINPNTFTNTTAFNQTIYVRVENPNNALGCFATTTANLVVYPILQPVISSVYGNDTLCVDYNTNEVQNEVILTTDLKDANYTYTWYLNGNKIPGETSDTLAITTASPGEYTVAISEITPTNPCGKGTSNTFIVNQSGQASLISVTQPAIFSDNPEVVVRVEGYGDYWFQMNDGPILNNGGVFKNVPGGTHTVYVYDKTSEDAPCDVLVIENIQVVDFPRFFTPNGDGYNDLWNISSLSDQPKARLTIFNRFGKLLAQIKPSGTGWDGTYKGAKLPADDYWFILNYIDEEGTPKILKSHFTLKL